MMDVFVIGGGAAGMMAAIEAAVSGCKVTVFEKNEKLGKKIYITGKGRCNVTNASDMETIFANINRNPKFLYSALYSYDNNAVMDFFEGEGVRLKVERGNRVFPESDHSSDIIRALERKLKSLGVKIRLNTCVERLIFTDDACIGLEIKGGKKLLADKVIVATGGASYPATGSTGDGYEFAKSAGHSIVTPEPSLIPLVSPAQWVRDLQGLSLKNVELTLLSDNRPVYSELGEMLFTHFGISGPLVLSASALYSTEKGKKKTVTLELDLKPGLDEDKLDKRILRDFDEQKNRQFLNSLEGLVPKRLIPVLVEKSGIPAETKVNSVSKEQRKALVNALKHFEIPISGMRPIEEAIITKGGVKVGEINPSTMESKKKKNLYFAGEVLDIDAMTGGFNLQLAWSTGYLAGRSED
ncbi:MAG: NAD(P)/FAD-dependent oxidoreductase [Lachnospiraceae bacterium]|nr:NAD(P)/FAD-dependent oxidoreductase [Lachnospiraceae bacterium]